MEGFFQGIESRWPAGREDYHWHVLPDPAAVSEHLAEPYRDLTTRPGLARVAPEWYHITVLHHQPVDDVSEHLMTEVVARVHDQCARLRPFTARVRRPEIWRSGLVCPVYRGQDFRQLWTMVRGVTAQLTGEQRQPGPLAYYPHLAIAYATGRLDDAGPREWLCDHDLPEPAIDVGALALVRQKHDGRTITWKVDEVIPLGASS